MYIRKASERGRVDIGWLKSSHTFSFGHYFDPSFVGYATLRVINDDYVEAGMGFETHPHKDMEIITFIKEGALEHKDSMGNHSVIRPGEIQIMSAGSGVLHSEFNHYKDKPTTFYQIWIHTKTPGIKPAYQQKNYLDFKKENDLTLLASEDGKEDSVQINQDARIHLASFDQDKKGSLTLEVERPVWIQMVSGRIEVEGQTIETGDGASFKQKEIQWDALEKSEFLVFEL